MSKLRCRYDESPEYCFSCPFQDCIRDDIEDDEQIKERYCEKKEYNKWGKRDVGVNSYDVRYQTNYRKTMPKEQKEKYLAWQREYQRAKRAMEKNTA